MASTIQIFCRFASGRVGYLSNADVTTGTTGEEIKTSTASNNLAQIGDVSVGTAYDGEVMTHAVAQASLIDGASTSCMLFAYLKGPDGRILVPIQGGGQNSSAMEPLCRPVRMQTGIVAWGAWEAHSDSATLSCCLSVYCSDGKADVFFAAGSESGMELKNKEGASIGQALAGSTIIKSYCVYPGTYGLNPAGGGLFAVAHKSSEGQLKNLYLAQKGNQFDTQWQYVPVRVQQNDTVVGDTDT
jgi:hypothetical protein